MSKALFTRNEIQLVTDISLYINIKENRISVQMGPSPT